jgi:hypothetical protein
MADQGLSPVNDLKSATVGKWPTLRPVEADVSVANNPGLWRMIAGLRNRLQVQLQIMSV